MAPSHYYMDEYTITGVRIDLRMAKFKGVGPGLPFLPGVHLEDSFGQAS